MIRIGAEPFEPAAELAAFTARVPGAGAIASFTGLVRGESGRVYGLDLDHYPALTEGAVAAIGDEARARFGLDGLVIVHRHGALAPGEPIVFVAAAAAHRRAAFEAVDYMMDRLKTEAPFWKREHGPDGSRWIEARDADLRDRARWA
jgi:molybdopterin synthase catalytic subunit